VHFAALLLIVIPYCICTKRMAHSTTKGYSGVHTQARVPPTATRVRCGTAGAHVIRYLSSPGAGRPLWVSLSRETSFYVTGRLCRTNPTHIDMPYGAIGSLSQRTRTYVSYLTRSRLKAQGSRLKAQSSVLAALVASRSAVAFRRPSTASAWIVAAFSILPRTRTWLGSG
jgi:hypothetical protein